MVVDNICASCKKCCANSSYIGLITEDELKIMTKILNKTIIVKPWIHKGIYEIVEEPCPAFDGKQCVLDARNRPCTCLLFPFRPDYDEGTKTWELDLAVTKCPGALAYAMKADEAKRLFEQMQKDGRWRA